MAGIFVVGVAVSDFVFLVDEMPDKAQKYRARDAMIVGGGCAGNAAVAIVRHGGDAWLAARLGDDPVGDLILDDLRNEGVHTETVDRAAGGRSSFSTIYVDRMGERQIMNYPGSGLADDPHWFDSVTGIDAVLADNRWHAGTVKAMAMARSRGIPGIIDAEDPVEMATLRDASHVAFSRNGLLGLTGGTDLRSALVAAGRQLDAWVCVTDGADGAYVIADSAVVNIPAFDVEAKDTLGAGDVWHGVLALRLAEGGDEIEAVRFANAAAALKCKKFGGRNGCPIRADTESLLKEKSECS